MNLVHVDARNLGPGLVGIRIVIEELVTKHQCYSEQSVLAARLPPNGGIQLLQPMNEEQCQKNDILCN